jgi:rRNA maturation endonuclease Nob1
MYAIIYKSDGFPICCQVAGVNPDPVVTWNSEADAKVFIAAKGKDAEFQAVEITDDSMDKLAKAMGCNVQNMTFEPYPG